MKTIVLLIFLLCSPCLARPNWLKSSAEKRDDHHTEFERWYSERWASPQGEKEFRQRLNEMLPTPVVPVVPMEPADPDYGKAVIDRENAGWGTSLAFAIATLARIGWTRRRQTET